MNTSEVLTPVRQGGSKTVSQRPVCSIFLTREKSSILKTSRREGRSSPVRFSVAGREHDHQKSPNDLAKSARGKTTRTSGNWACMRKNYKIQEALEQPIVSLAEV